MFYSIPNRVSQIVSPVEKPWENQPVVPAAALAGLDAYNAWRLNAATKGRFISGLCGAVPNARVDSGNPATYMHAIIADYDSEIVPAQLDALADAAYCDFLPAYYGKSFRHGRLIWMLDSPVLVPPDPKLYKVFMAEVAKQLKLGKWLAGIDTAAFGLSSNYYDVLEWVPLHIDARIPAQWAGTWLYQASKKFSSIGNDVKIPLDKIAEEVEKRFPGRWLGSFELDSRGVRFWDLSADHTTGAWVKENGMQCFTGDKPFVPWISIFGRAFVEQYQTDKIGNVIVGTVVDNQSNYWVKQPEGDWRDYDKSTFHTLMRVGGFDQTKPKGCTFSEMDQLEVALQKTNRVALAVPLAGVPSGIVVLNDERFLNTQESKWAIAAPPFVDLDTPMEWDRVGRKYFPFIYDLTNELYRGKEEPKIAEKQLFTYLRWLQHGYQHLQTLDPHPGLVQIRAGAVDSGKTLHEQRVTGGMLGGHIDATKHLVNNSRWTDALTGKFFWVLDDCVPLTTQRDIDQFTARIKAVSANAQVTYEKKFKETRMLPWCGRISATANMDDASMRALPSMDSNAKDKLFLVKIAKGKCFDGYSRQELADIIAEQLPRFARFLTEWKAPEEVCKGRFGTFPYHHPELLDASYQHGDAATVMDILVPWLEQLEGDPNYKGQKAWTGTGANLFMVLSAVNPAVMREFKVRTFGIALGNLARNGNNIHKKRKGNLNEWSIGFDLKHRAEGTGGDSETISDRRGLDSSAV